MDNMISVIIPVYNAQTYLSQCVDSVLQQSYPHWQLILIDDGSSDESGRICDEYCARDNRIQVLHTPNRGVSAARNLGIVHSQGDWICFVDSDDYLKSNTFETILQYATGNDLLVFGYETIVESSIHSFPLTTYFSSLTDLRSNFPALHSAGLFNPIWNKLYRAELWSQHQIQFADDCSLGEDMIVNLEFITHCTHICVIPDALYLYRENTDNSLSHRFRANAPQIFWRLKQATDAAFGNHSDIVNYSDTRFVNDVLDTVKTTCYCNNYTKNQVLQSIIQWREFPFFSLRFEQHHTDSVWPFWECRLYLNKRYMLLYSYFQCRKAISRLLHRTI